jgi:DNA-binding transcriptional ArsR family regulator
MTRVPAPALTAAGAPGSAFGGCRLTCGARGRSSKHLKVLERAGLVARSRERQCRPARLEAEPIREVAEWTERYRVFWEESYERLDVHLEELQGRGKEKGYGRKR